MAVSAELGIWVIVSFVVWLKRWSGGFHSSLVCFHLGPVVILHALFGVWLGGIDECLFSYHVGL